MTLDYLVRYPNLMLIIRLFIIIFTALVFISCQPNQTTEVEQGVVVVEKAELRNSTGLVSATIKEVKRGELVDILERRTANNQDFVHIRIGKDNPVEGWLESHQIIKKDLVDDCEKLATEWQDIPTQAVGKTKDKLKLRLTPGRDTEVATVLAAGTKLEIVGRTRVERKDENDQEKKYDSWYKVRLTDNPVIKAGWVYAESIEITPPDLILALPGAGRRFVAWHSFGEFTDPELNVTQNNYIILDKYAYSKESQIDFDRIYVVAWDLETHGYKSILIQSQVDGLYPLKVESQSDGYLFTVNLLDKQSKPVAIRYKITGDATTNTWKAAKEAEAKPITKPVVKPKK